MPQVDFATIFMQTLAGDDEDIVFLQIQEDQEDNLYNVSPEGFVR